MKELALEAYLASSNYRLLFISTPIASKKIVNVIFEKKITKKQFWWPKVVIIELCAFRWIFLKRVTYLHWSNSQQQQRNSRYSLSKCVAGPPVALWCVIYCIKIALSVVMQPTRVNNVFQRDLKAGEVLNYCGSGPIPFLELRCFVLTPELKHFFKNCVSCCSKNWPSFLLWSTHALVFFAESNPSLTLGIYSNNDCVICVAYTIQLLL